MLVVDFMHEFELGVWKAIFTHLIRILMAHGDDAVQSLNERYRLVPTFGKATIRRFSNNASAMKKLAARNFEDLLQCALPVFEELLPDAHNTIILDLLFTLAYWHALAKLRLHTDFTLDQLQAVTTMLGRQLRYFTRVTCAAFTTKELPREEAARGRRTAKKAAAASAAGTAPPKSRGTGGSKIKVFNMETYKGHSLGDYVRTIRFFGTVDSYSTQPGELEHRRVKRYYARTNKNDAVGQMTQLERRESALLKISREKLEAERIPPISTLENPVVVPAAEQPVPPTTGKRKRKLRTAPKKVQPTLDFAESESLPYTAPDAHFHISQSRNFHCNIPTWLSQNEGDPAVIDFLPKLREHLLGRLLHPTWSGNGREFTPEEHAKLLIVNDTLYRHKVLRINYTSYDVRRGQDSMNPRTHADIMMLAPEDDTNSDSHPFTYARVIGVFHVDVRHNVLGASTSAVPISFLWVRRFRLDHTFKGGFKRKRLHRVEFIPNSDPTAYGFVDPDEVIRGAHLVPAFAHGPTEPVSYTSLARRKDEFDDWLYHYVNFFVDRDMFMRYLGGGVGHYQVQVPDNEGSDTELQDDEESEGEPEPDEDVLPVAGSAVPPVGDDDQEEEEEEEPRAAEEEEEILSSGEEDEGDPWADDSDEEQEEDPDSDNLGPEDGEDLENLAPADFGYDDL
ncbi:hypothetical protein B0H17DRAFT_1197774 [Mycena rosella]|uniref:Uncharacterized protein n=1 Tax=Mycena rosella TaxID=1033263 RepID=A0AAD7GP57_MYCRO|nr:hypothetical protein B0H17DRAFT_1197774 [Mycena rosella]